MVKLPVAQDGVCKIDAVEGHNEQNSSKLSECTVKYLSYMLTKEEQNNYLVFIGQWNFLSKVTIQRACTALLVTSVMPCV